jgi:hypothetical protein
LGSIGFAGYYDPNDRHWAIIVKEKDGSTALAQPLDYDEEYNDSGSGADNNGPPSSDRLIPRLKGLHSLCLHAASKGVLFSVFSGCPAI